LIYEFALLYAMLSSLGEMFVPVLVYATVISAMCIFALNRCGRVNAARFKWVFIGAIVFVLSDSTIAINKFLTSIPVSGLWIMSLYAFSQYLIVNGILKMRGGENVLKIDFSTSKN